jgi:dCTP diphosphatase
MSDIASLTAQIVSFRDARDWKQFHNAKDVALSLVLEATEVLEHFQWKNEKEIAEYLASHKKEVGEELADALYWILLMSHDLDIDIGEAFRAKMEKNEGKYPVEKAKGSAKKYTAYR